MFVKCTVKTVFYLKLLLNCFLLLHCYEYGYHPSAEEMDSLLRGSRTWTRNILAQSRHSSGSSINSPQQFVPKFNFKQEHSNHLKTRNDLQQVAFSTKRFSQQGFSHVPPDQNGDGSSLEFTFFDQPNNDMLEVDLKPQPHAAEAAEQSVFNSNLVSNDDSLTHLPNMDIPTTNANSSGSKDNLPIFFTNPATGKWHSKKPAFLNKH